MVKIAVLVSGGGTNLQALIDREQQGELGSGKICLVLSSRPDVYALERAKKPASKASWWTANSAAVPNSSAQRCSSSCKAEESRWWCWQDF